MKKRINDLLDYLSKRLFSSTYQVQRIIVLVAVALALTSISFAGYYYYDRYYTSQPEKVDVMLEKAEQAVRENPDDPTARLNLAEVYMTFTRFEESIEQSSMVMDVYPDNQRAWFLYGVANALGGHPQEAIPPLEKFMEANKDSEMPHLNKTLQSAAYYLGDAYLRVNQPDKAVSSLELAAKWSETDADAMYKLGMAYIAAGRNPEALNMFQQATRLVPDYTECYQGMAVAFQNLNEPDYVNYAFGMVAYSNKDYDAALSLLLPASQKIPQYVPVFDGLGLTYEAMNDWQNAKIYYDIALKLNPNDYTAATGSQRAGMMLNK